MILSIKIYLYFLVVNKPNTCIEKGINVKKKGVRKKWFIGVYSIPTFNDFCRFKKYRCI